MSTSSSQKLYVAFVDFGEVVIRTFGRVLGSQSENYDANGSESVSGEVSGSMDMPSTGTAIVPLEPSMG